MKHYESEAAIYGVVLVAGLVVIMANRADASWDVLVKIVATVAVFWAAHIYAGIVANLDTAHADPAGGSRLLAATRHSVGQSWGMLVAALIPVVMLMLGVAQVLSDEVAIWGTLWVAVGVLGALGYLKVASWAGPISLRIASALITSLFGLGLILLKALIY